MILSTTGSNASHLSWTPLINLDRSGIRFFVLILLNSTIIEMDIGTMPIQKFYGTRPMKPGQHEILTQVNKSSSATIDVWTVEHERMIMGQQVRLLHGGEQ